MLQEAELVGTSSSNRGERLHYGGEGCGTVVSVVHGTFCTFPTVGKLWSESFLFPPKPL
jgi:hypothetical protein